MKTANWAEMLLPSSAVLALVGAVYPWIILFGSDRTLSLGLCYTTALLAVVATNVSINFRWQRQRRFLLVASGLYIAVTIVWLVNGAYPDATDWWTNYWMGWIGYGHSSHSSPQADTIALLVIYWSSLGMADPGWGEEGARRLLAWGLTAQMLVLVAARLVGVETGGHAGQTIMPFAVIFLGSILFTLAMARARAIRQRGQQKGVEQATMSYSWIPLAILLFLFVALMSTPLVPWLLGTAMSTLWWVLRLIITVISLPIGYLAEWLIGVVRSLMEGRPLEQQPNAFRLGDGMQELQERLQAVPRPTPLWMSIAFVISILIVVVIIIARRLKFSNSDLEAGVEEERESLEPKLRFLSILRRLGRRRSRRSSLQKSWGAGSIEELYHWLLQYGKQIGRAREIHETPHEYQRVIRDYCPDKGRFITGVTDAFERSRYGNEVISQDVIRDLAATRDE